MDMTKNITEAITALTKKPVLSTSAERVFILDEIKSEKKDLPQPLRFAYTMQTLLGRVSVPVEPYDLIAGRALDRLLTDEEEERFKAYNASPDNPNKIVLFDSGHGSYDWQSLVKSGLGGLIAKAKDKKATATSEQTVFLDGIIGVLGAISDYTARYAAEAERTGKADLAATLRSIVTEPPHSFRAALQLMWIVALVDCAYVTPNPTLTLGRMDSILYPYYKSDVESGRLTRDEAKEYITDYYCKHNLIMGRGEHQVGGDNATGFSRICNFDAPQYLLLAGSDESGKSAANELTELFAECIVPEFKNPVIVFYYTKNLNAERPKLWKTLAQKALKSSSMMFYNDDAVRKAYQKIGLKPEETKDFYHFGCNWGAPCMDANWMLGGPKAVKYVTAPRTPEEDEIIRLPYMRSPGTYDYPEFFLDILEELAKREANGETLSIDDFYSSFFEKVAAYTEKKLAVNHVDLMVRKRAPSSVLDLTDCFLPLSIERAECFSASAKYHFEVHGLRMFGTVVDSFIVVDALVFRKKSTTLVGLLEAVKADFVGYEELWAQMRKVPKYGSDDKIANAHVKRLVSGFDAIVYEKNRPYFEAEGLFLQPCMQSDTWHLKLGEKCGATADGRRAGKSFAQNSNPSPGAAINGLTAVLNSLLERPYGELTSGALNLDVEPKAFNGESGLNAFAALLGTYFNRGGLHAQVSAVNVDELEDAQRDPASHADLRVRVTGYSGIFVDICKRLQDDIIWRMKNE